MGCGTSFHAAQTAGDALEALEAVLAPPQVDTLVLVSHEGETPLTLEAARAFSGHRLLVTGAPESSLAKLCEEVVVATPEIAGMTPCTYEAHPAGGVQFRSDVRAPA